MLVPMSNDVSRLVLGTVQIGAPYGAANRTGMPSTERAIRLLRRAHLAGIAAFDTARAYGAAEERIGAAFDGADQPDTITKLDPLSALPEDASEAEAECAVEESVSAVKYFADGDFNRGFATLAGNLIPGGSQIKRVKEADMMVERGVLPERELWMARMFGWQWTPSGKRYLRQLRGADTAKDRAYYPDAQQEGRAADYRYQQSIKAEEKAAKKQAKRDKQDEEYYRRGGR